MHPYSYTVAGASADKKLVEQLLIDEMKIAMSAVLSKDWAIVERHLMSAVEVAKHLKLMGKRVDK